MTAWRSSLTYLEDYNLKINYKAEVEEPVVPPKLRGKHYTDVEALLGAKLNWLTPHIFVDSNYNSDTDGDSYFEKSFVTIKKLGEGSYAKVIEVKSVDDGQHYAIKVSKEPYKNKLDRKLKVKEVDHHFPLSGHTNVVTLHKAWEEDRFLFLQLELCSQGFLEDAPLPEEECWAVLSDILQGLDYIHNEGKGHFDIKLSNLLYGSDGRFKLSDFGLMLTFGEDNDYRKEGDSKYVAPELMSGSSEDFTSKADIFSLGISVLEMAANVDLPGRGRVWNALRNGILPFSGTENLSDGLLRVILRMMCPNKEERPSAKELLETPTIKEIISERNSKLGFQTPQIPAELKDIHLTDTESIISSCSSSASSSSAISYVESRRHKHILTPTHSLDIAEGGEIMQQPVASVSEASCSGRNAPIKEYDIECPWYLPICQSDKLDSNYNMMTISPLGSPPISLTSMSSLEEEDSLSAAISLSTPPSPTFSSASSSYTLCDEASPSSLHKAMGMTQFQCPSRSLHEFGIRPIRLTRESRREYREKQYSRRMARRALDFDDEN